MSTLTPKSPAEAVANGAQLLDEKHPGWWRHIDTDTLDVGSISCCICAQLDMAIGRKADFPAWDAFAMDLTGNTGDYWRFGFTGHSWRWTEVTNEWLLVIQARLDADRLADEIRTQRKALVAQKEKMLA